MPATTAQSVSACCHGVNAALFITTAVAAAVDESSVQWAQVRLQAVAEHLVYERQRLAIVPEVVLSAPERSSTAKVPLQLRVMAILNLQCRMQPGCSKLIWGAGLNITRQSA
jgi:hypothetical protein